MALCKNITTENGVSIREAYIKIERFEGKKNFCDILVSTYVSKDYAIKNKEVDSNNYRFIPDISIGSVNFIKQGYEYLKTLPEYANAVDVLEEGQML